MIAFDSIAQMLQDTEQSGLPLWENILESDCRRQDLPRARSLERMGAMLDAMVQADESYQAQDRSHSGLSGGDGAKMTLYAAGDPLCGPLLSQVMAGALRMGECNACMKRIVAAPTAGACGVLPAVLLPCARHFSLSREQLVQALYVASGFGMVIAARASISGAEGGCQAEIGSAAAMAAPALVHLRGGTPSMMAHACAMAVKNLLGLVCDPVGGLVEVPCVKRNVIGAMDALSAAQMALAGIESRVPQTRFWTPWQRWAVPCPPPSGRRERAAWPQRPLGWRTHPRRGDMKRLTHLFFYTLASIAFLNVFSHSFPSLPALYACMTIFSLLFGVSFLTASGMPSAWTSRKVSSAVWDHWKKILGALFLLNGALCPTGFLLWFFLRFDQDLILCTQIFGSLSICFASLIPLYRANA